MKHIARFESETVADIKETQRVKSCPYGITLGDIVYSKGVRNCIPLMKEMRRIMSKSHIGFPIFRQWES